MTMMLALINLTGTLWAAPALEPPRRQVEAKIQAIYARMQDIRKQSPFTESEPRKTLEDIVAQPSRCAGRAQDKYCRLYSEILAKKPGLTPDDVFAAFTAEEIMGRKLLGGIVRSTGERRVFAKLAREAGLAVWDVESSAKSAYAEACHEGSAKLSRMKPGPRTGHGAAAVRWGGKWRLLDTSANDKPRYAKAGPPPLRELAVDKPEDLLGREVYFGLPADPYLDESRRSTD